MAKKKRADEVRQLYRLSNNWTRKQWEFTNQKGFDFAHDEQLTQEEKKSLNDQGMPSFTINRILPVVEMLNYYATAKNPRWQAVGIEGSDADVAAVFGDLADYIWHGSDGGTIYANAINDAICKGIGYLVVTVDQDADNGMGEVSIKQPEPFDVYVDPKSRDLLFRDAAYILIRKVLPRNHLAALYPDHKAKIKKAASDEQTQNTFSVRAQGDSEQALFQYNDQQEVAQAYTADGEEDTMLEFFEVYEKVKIPHVNVFLKIPPTPVQLEEMQQQVQVKMQELQQELGVKLKEQEAEMAKAVEKGDMLPERFELEMQNAQKMMQSQLEGAQQQFMSDLQAATQVIENKVITQKEFDLLMKDPKFQEAVADAVRFHDNRIKLTCCAGDKLLYEQILPPSVKDYPVVPFHYKWTGTPFPMSAVAPLIGKQREINKSHQIMVHNASLGSSLRWLHEEGSLDMDYWEKYSSSPGALLPVRPGAQPPTPVMPAPLSNAFFTVVQEGKADMEQLSGIYSAMQGDTSAQHETFRGMLAIDEYGTRRIKQWMQNSIEPGLRQMGRLVMQFSQAVYSAHKRFRIIQPSALQGESEQEINIPIYNDMGEAIGKSMDLEVAKFDVQIIAGSTLPVNRWAYLEELKQLLQLGVVDDIAVLGETDIRNKMAIANRKSQYAQMQSQIGSMDEAIKDKDGTIETLERQLVQAGIKMKIKDAEVEITKKKNDVQLETEKAALGMQTKVKQAENDLLGQAQLQGQALGQSMKAMEEEAQLAQKEEALKRQEAEAQEASKENKK